MEERLALWRSAAAVSEVCVRPGQHSRATPKGTFSKGRRSGLFFRGSRRSKKNLDDDPLLDDVAFGGTMLDDDPLLIDVAEVLRFSKDYITQLLDHPTVVGLLSRRKLQLDKRSGL